MKNEKGLGDSAKKGLVVGLAKQAGAALAIWLLGLVPDIFRFLQSDAPVWLAALAVSVAVLGTSAVYQIKEYRKKRKIRTPAYSPEELKLMRYREESYGGLLWEFDWMRRYDGWTLKYAPVPLCPKCRARLATPGICPLCHADYGGKWFADPFLADGAREYVRKQADAILQGVPGGAR